MTPFVLFGLLTILTGLGVLAMHFGQTLESATVDPFSPPARPRDAASDTVGSDALVRTAPPPTRHDGGWQMMTLSSLSEVEQFLDRLEACGIREREVNTIGEEGFAVRFR